MKASSTTLLIHVDCDVDKSIKITLISVSIMVQHRTAPHRVYWVGMKRF